MARATRDAQLATMERRYEMVKTVIGEIRIRNLSSAEFGELEGSSVDENGKVIRGELKKSKAKFYQAAVVDDDGNLEFAPEELSMIMAMDSAIVEPVVDRIYKMCNGIEAAEKNSETTGDSCLPIDLLIGSEDTEVVAS